MSTVFGNMSDEEFSKSLGEMEEVSEQEMDTFLANLKEVEQNKTVKMSQRHNSGKTQVREVDPAFILGIGEVLTKSREKYDAFNWQNPTKLSTPYESLFRHLMAFQMGEDFDKESGKHHLLHCATNLMFMYYHITRNPEFSDDRGFKGEKNGEDC